MRVLHAPFQPGYTAGCVDDFDRLPGVTPVESLKQVPYLL